jgi:hypothetical protein
MVMILVVYTVNGYGGEQDCYRTLVGVCEVSGSRWRPPLAPARSAVALKSSGLLDQPEIRTCINAHDIQVISSLFEMLYVNFQASAALYYTDRLISSPVELR